MSDKEKVVKIKKIVMSSKIGMKIIKILHGEELDPEGLVRSYYKLCDDVFEVCTHD